MSVTRKTATATTSEPITEAEPAGPSGPAASRLSPRFRVELRRRHDEAAPVEIVFVNARTIASARHAARLAHPEAVILAVQRE